MLLVILGKTHLISKYQSTKYISDTTEIEMATTSAYVARNTFLGSCLFISYIYCVQNPYYNTELSFDPGPSFCSCVIFVFPVLYDL